MRVAVINARDYTSAEQQIKAAASMADLIELRLDCWSAIDIEAVTAFAPKHDFAGYFYCA